jgi:hypothetical protein
MKRRSATSQMRSAGADSMAQQMPGVKNTLSNNNTGKLVTMRILAA